VRASIAYVTHNLLMKEQARSVSCIRLQMAQTLWPCGSYLHAGALLDVAASLLVICKYCEAASAAALWGDRRQI
jgi:hypothetical protein